MKSQILTFCVAIALGCFCANCNAQTHFPYYHQRVSMYDTFKSSPKDIILIGDSITNGCEWCELFGNKNFKNRGINADTSVGVYDRLESTLRGKPAKMFLMIGTNDIANGASVDSLCREMERIIDKTAELSPKTKLYVQSLLPVNNKYNIFGAHMDKGPQIIEANNCIKELCARKGITWIDLYSQFKNKDDEKMNLEYTNDGLHLMAAGYTLWGNILKKYL